MLLEVSESGVREILTPEKATLIGMIASDGSNILYRSPRPRGRGYRTHYRTTFFSKDKELINIYDRLFEEIYSKAPRHYARKRNGLVFSWISSKGIFYDLYDLGIKLGAYEFHVPREHLDDDGKRAFLRGFFSGDGDISIGDSITFRFSSTSKSGMEGLHQILEDLGFHPYEILERERPKFRTSYIFSIPKKEHMKFIDEIGSYKPRHVHIFEEMKKGTEGCEEH
jgi:intein/homing endonuclease